MKIQLAFSPCPNDTFIFEALVNKRIDTKGLDFEVFYEDVESLNQNAIKGTYAVTKLSYHAYAYVSGDYQLLDSGSALGNKCGPLLISKSPFNREDLTNMRVAIPGKMTTAAFLFGLYAPQGATIVPMVFSEIEKAVLDGTVDAGVIIHENRFTYQDKGLIAHVDLGDYWENSYNYPIPLGGIAIKRELDAELKNLIQSLIRESIEFAFNNPALSQEYILSYSQEMAPDVIRKHIDLYVNDYSVALGDKGKAAIKKLYDEALDRKLIPGITQPIFV